MVALVEGFEVQAVHAGRLGEGQVLGRPDGVGPRLVVDAEDVAGELAGAAVIDGRGWAGAMDAVSELGLALARAVDAARGGARAVVLRLAVGNDFLLQIGKLRAARALWSRVGELGDAPPLTLWVEPSAHGYTVYDPWVNLLRGTAGVFAAIVGGADWVSPRPWDAALGAPDAHARRLAENTFHLLVHEGHLAVPRDAAAGSWALEAMTSEVAARAWTAAQRIEAEGVHAVDVLALGAPARAARRERIVKRLDGIVGTSMFPNLDEQRPERAPHAAGDAGDGGPVPRAAAPFEALRARAEGASPRPTAFLACLGPLAEHSARALWVKGFYEVAGIRATVSPPLADPAAAVAAWRASGAPLAVVCGSDEAYAAQGEAFVRALKEAGARVVLAGRPKGLELPVDGKVYLGLDVAAALDAELAAQGVRA